MTGSFGGKSGFEKAGLFTDSFHSPNFTGQFSGTGTDIEDLEDTIIILYLMASTGYTLAHPADLDGETSYTFTCGKIDAGIAVLIGSHAHLIEFPSLLLPPGCEPGSIVSITCTRDNAAEKAQADSFWDLQTKIVDQFGVQSPQPPNLRLRSITQTSVTLEWDKLELAQCKLLSLSIWKNGQRLGTLPNPLNNTSTKLSGLDLDSEYTFHLVMKTTGGSFNSQQIKVKTHSLNDTSGINVCFGVIVPEELKDQSKEAIQQLDGRWSDKIQIDTTHFVCTMPYQPQHGPNKSAQPNTFPSLEYQRALQLSIPVVQPSWLQACLHERKMVPIAAHYLGAQPPPLGSSPTTIPSAGPSGRPRAASKSNIHSSTPISPSNTAEANSSSPGPSGASSRQHERANSAPTITTISDSGRLHDQIEKPSAGLAVIIESKDGDEVTSHKANGNMEGTSYNPDQSASSRHVRTESDSEKTLKLSTSDQFPQDQPHVPTPPKFSAALSDILKENVDSPAENDSSPSGHKPMEFPNPMSHILSDRPESTPNGDDKGAEEEAEPRSTHPTSSPPNNKLPGQTSGLAEQSQPSRGIVDDGEDDPFSAASPTISNPSPLGDRPSFSRSNSLNHGNFGGLLSPASNHLSPVIGPSTGPAPSAGSDENRATMIPDQPLEEKQEIPEVDRSVGRDQPAAPSPPSPTALDSLASPSKTIGENKPHANGGSSSEVFDEISIGSDSNQLPDDEDHEVSDSKGESGSGDTFFSTASVPLQPSHPDPTLHSDLIQPHNPALLSDLVHPNLQQQHQPTDLITSDLVEHSSPSSSPPPPNHLAD
uniref:RGD-binding protein n=1 Tax=Puccinia graminis f. sp. tritici TaxID=56615 RepID=G3KLG9_PUCGR|nr:RGD-binding protein [Puccinia graminis f. sp. tritici]